MEDKRIEEEIGHLYEQSLVIPAQPKRRLFLLCPVGIVGSGKTTVLKPLAEALALVRISGDEIRELLKAHGLGYESVSRIGEMLIRKYLSKGFSIAIDSDCAGSFRTNIPEWAKEFNADILWIHIDPPEDFILNKLKNYKHTWLFANAEDAIANYERRKPLHEHLDDIPFLFTFDPSRDDIETQINKGRNVIEETVKIPKS